MKIKIIILSIILLLSFGIYSFVKPYYLFLTNTLHISPIKTVFTNGGFKKVNGIVAILLLGKAGGDYDGPNLTDSINVIIFNLNNKHIYTISVPRDVWSDVLQEKINAAYAVGEATKLGSGILIAKSEVEAIIGTPIEYGAVIDFNSFKEVVDYVEGVDITVENTFTDTEYPRAGHANDPCFSCRYERIHFEKGIQHMNGDTALKYARSRHADGKEGSDFARNARQQKLIAALTQRLVVRVKKHNLSDLETMYHLFDKVITRDITNQEAASIGKQFISQPLHFISVPLLNSYFTVPSVDEYNGQYVLVPNDKIFTEIHSYIRCRIEDTSKCIEPK